MKVNTGMGVPHGPHFEISKGVMLKAATFDLLYPQIIEYRLHHGIPPGDPVKDVNDYICGKWPSFCLPEPGDGPDPAVLRASLAQRVTTWAAISIRNQPAGGYELVDDGAASDRAALCLQCPYNKPWRTNCAPCWAVTETLLAQLRRLRSTGPTKPLFACEVDGSDNRTSVFMPDETMKPDAATAPRFWVSCWKRKL